MAMARPKRECTEEFKQQMVNLFNSEKPRVEIARKDDLTPSALNLSSLMQKKWIAFIRKIDTKTDEYSVVINAIDKFLARVYTKALCNESFKGKWIADKQEWI